MISDAHLCHGGGRVVGLDDQTAGKKTREVKALSPPCFTWEFIQRYYCQLKSCKHTNGFIVLLQAHKLVP